MAARLRSEGLLSSPYERLDNAEDKKEKDAEKEGDKKDENKEKVNGPAKDAPTVWTVQSWRLRWCALFILAAAALQALVVGGQLQVWT